MTPNTFARLNLPPNVQRGLSKMLVLVPMLTLKDARAFKEQLDQLDFPRDEKDYRRLDLTKSILAGGIIEAMSAGLVEEPDSALQERVARLTGTDQFAPELVATLQVLADKIDALAPHALESAQLAMKHLKDQAEEPAERYFYFTIEEAVATRRAQLRGRPLTDEESPVHPQQLAAWQMNPAPEALAFSLS